MARPELHSPVETFLDVVWPYDKLGKCSPDNFLSEGFSTDPPSLPKILDIFKGGDLYKIQIRAVPAAGFYLIEFSFENCIEFVEIYSLYLKK